MLMARYARFVDGVTKIYEEDGTEVVDEAPETGDHYKEVENSHGDAILEPDPTSVEPPPLADMVNSFASELSTWIRSGFPMSDEQELRWELCQACDYLSEKGQCLQCGCWMRWKIKMGTAYCKLGKW